jgi:hypothetical protein
MEQCKKSDRHIWLKPTGVYRDKPVLQADRSHWVMQGVRLTFGTANEQPNFLLNLVKVHTVYIEVVETSGV